MQAARSDDDPQVGVTIARCSHSGRGGQEIGVMPVNNGQDKCREIAIVIDESAAVRLWLDRSCMPPCITVEDLEYGIRISLTPTELSELIHREGSHLDRESILYVDRHPSWC